MTPTEWRRVPFGELCVSSQYGLSVASDPSGETPMIGMKDMVDGSIKDGEWAAVSLRTDERERYLLRHGDLLLNRTNSPDLVGKVSRWDRPEAAVFASYLVRFAVDPTKADSNFLNHHLNSEAGQAALKSISTRGVSQANINPTVFKEAYDISLPPLREQRRIAAVLDTWDDAIVTAERLIKSGSQRLEWLIGSTLTGKRRLPKFTKPWRTVRLADVLTEHKLRSTGNEVVHSVSVHRGLVDQIEHLGRSFAAASTAHYNRVTPGDIVYTKSPTGDFPLGIVKQSVLETDAIVSPLYGVFSPESDALGVLLDALFSVPANAIRYLTPLVQKGAKNTIAVTNTQFLQGRMHLPADQAEIDTLANLIGTQRQLIINREKDVANLRCQKRGLAQKLLTGEWRVPENIGHLMPNGAAAAALERTASL